MTRLAKGQVLDGRYQIERLIATGGQANVYRGVHLGLDRPVAIKVLRLGLPPEVMRRTARRFEQEAKLLAALRDPHTITLYDFGHLKDGTLYMVFEFVEGHSLKQVINTQGKLEPWRIAKILKQTCASLQEAHQLGVLHRDIKPANIMLYNYLGRSDLIKLLDFGIAKILEESRKFSYESLTGAKGVIGTPRYIPPEAYHQDSPMNAASDIYSLGLVIYELMVGKPAIRGSTPIDIYRVHMARQTVVLPQELEVPQGLRQIVNRMLEYECHARYKRVDEVLWDLQQWRKQEANPSDNLSIAPYGHDPQDLSIPDPYEEIAPTQTITAAEIESFIVSDDYSDNTERYNEPSLVMLEQKTSPFLHTPFDQRNFLNETPLSVPDNNMFAVTVTRPKHVGKPDINDAPTSSISLPHQVNTPTPRAILDASTAILRNTSDIDALLLASTPPSQGLQESSYEEEEDIDSTQNVSLDEILEEDILQTSNIPPGIVGDMSEPNDPTDQVKITPQMRRDLGLGRLPKSRDNTDDA